jgi:hypothetical protein
MFQIVPSQFMVQMRDATLFDLSTSPGTMYMPS